MPIIQPASEIYMIISGKHRGRRCVIRNLSPRTNLTGVLILDEDKTVFVKPGELAKLETPGWKNEFHAKRSYGLEEYLSKHQGSGRNYLRTRNVSQPSVLKADDKLANGENVLDGPRLGYNSSILIHLDRTGWVELASRLPIALYGNSKWKLPIQLKKNDKLITTCHVVQKPTSEMVGWVTVYLDTIECDINTPSCVPLALS